MIDIYNKEHMMADLKQTFHDMYNQNVELALHKLVICYTLKKQTSARIIKCIRFVTQYTVLR